MANIFKIKLNEQNKVIATRLDESEPEEGWMVLDEQPIELMMDPFDWIYEDGKFTKDTAAIEARERQEALQRELGSYQQLLESTDYVITKISEAAAFGEDVDALKVKYASIIQDRVNARAAINRLQEQMNGEQ